MVRHLPAMQETQVCSLGLEDPLEYGCESFTINKTKHQIIDTSNCGTGEDS